MYVLELSKDSQELQLITVKLTSFNTEKQRIELLNELSHQWFELEKSLISLISLDSNNEQIQLLNDHLEKIQLAVDKIPLLTQLTESAQEAEIQASRLHLNMNLIEKGFSRAISNELAKLDQEANTELNQQKYTHLQQSLNQHRQLSDFLHKGMQVFRLAAEVDESADNHINNQLQREAMRHFQALKHHPSSSVIAQEIKQDWLSQIQPNLIGPSNLFISSRDALNSSRIANAHLEIQANAAAQIALFSSVLVQRIKQQIDIEGQQLKTDSNAFVVLIFSAGVLYTFLIWLTNWHFISKGIMQPVIATSQAMQAIANEKQNTPLPQADNLELQQMMTSLETLRSYAAQVKSISEMDGLTGTYNRRYFDHKLTQALTSPAHSNQFISIILFDVDNFKQFNDRYGHIIGDQCLRQITAIIKGMPEMQGQIFARYGGEEFIVFLTSSDHSIAHHVAELMRKAVVKLAIPHADSQHQQIITISVGVNTKRSNIRLTPEALIHQADLALYQAKASGKNCIESTVNIVNNTL
ncbi:GGDEF domain-containing protein [Shewanella sp. D64]|uniref:GGDEF domain-containing protein n=1 Tax=unclassified Shewanella TaxID=196818 RepID=UPI0022BA5816|nr:MULTISPECIES: GGDEF domain-containing protein [unclassified Shewanella]MEC4726611.1 GGDEF domain-containing protein [Shewanella sp. D64]MEC4737348.1 GGDEF domain-containing protein [Shewanella sp. E94]WBJ97171.1 GGDEF domain-containing protein [Shewanella sp. MTB7]